MNQRTRSVLSFAQLLAMFNNTKPVNTGRTKLTAHRHSGIPKGCKVFEIDGIRVMALNEKNARRKASKHLITNGGNLK